LSPAQSFCPPSLHHWLTGDLLVRYCSLPDVRTNYKMGIHIHAVY
jgi:hypothetical protein